MKYVYAFSFIKYNSFISSWYIKKSSKRFVNQNLFKIQSFINNMYYIKTNILTNYFLLIDKKLTRYQKIHIHINFQQYISLLSHFKYILHVIRSEITCIIILLIFGMQMQCSFIARQ